MRYGPSFRIALEPLGVSLQGISPVQIGSHTPDHVQTTFLRSRTTLPEEITITEILAFAMKWHVRLIKRHDTGDANQYEYAGPSAPASRQLWTDLL